MYSTGPFNSLKSSFVEIPSKAAAVEGLKGIGASVDCL